MKHPAGLNRSRRDRAAAGAVWSLAIVLSVYLGPLALSTLLGVLHPAPVYGTLEAPAREPVYWDGVLPTQPEPEAEVHDGLDEDVAPPEDAVGEPEPPPADDEPDDAVADADHGSDAETEGEVGVSGAPGAETLTPQQARRTRARAAARRPVVRRAPMTGKEKRRAERRQRRRERRAERKQCHELVDQIVEVEPQVWWLGRELVNCYRAHPQQLTDMGGAAWAEDERGKRIGARVYPSRRPQGEIGRAAGFQRRDVIRSLNGIPFRSWPMASLAATQLLRGKGKVKVLRGDEELLFRYEVRDPDEVAARRQQLDAVAAGPP